MKLFSSIEVFLGTCVHFSFLSCQLACMVLSIVTVAPSCRRLISPLLLPSQTMVTKNVGGKCVSKVLSSDHTSGL